MFCVYKQKRRNIIVTSNVYCRPGDAYSECLKMDHMVELLKLEAFGKVKSGQTLEQQLQALTSKLVAPDMPQTSAVLERIPASESYPGAIYRLAGDR